MHTLLLRLAGPMQSWGTQSRFLERDTGLEPSKSGVIGLLCAALGYSRSEPVDHLACLVMGVRVDREGVMQRDYQTALGVARASEKVRPDRSGSHWQEQYERDAKRTVVSNRYFLADADFLVGLSHPDLALLHELDTALAAPRWPLALGRKAFVPGEPVRLPGGGVRSDRGLEEALRGEPWRPRAGEPHWRKPPERLRTVLETTAEQGQERRIDQPSPGAVFLHRRFLPRHVMTTFWPTGEAAGAVRIEEVIDG